MMTNFKFSGKSKQFITDVTKILSGSVIAQILNFLALPILAKIYTPEDIAKIGLAFSFINFFAVLTCLRFEMAIISTDDETEATHVFYLCIFSIIFTLPIMALTLFLLSKYSVMGFGSFTHPEQLALILLTLVFASLTLVFRNLSIFFQRYSLVSTSLFIQQVSSSGLQIFFGMLHPDFLSLISADFLARFSSSIYVYKKLAQRLKKSFSRSDLHRIYHRHKKFMIYSTPSSFLENTSGNIIIPFLFYLFTPVEVGCYTLIQKLSAFPASALSRAIADVFHERLSKVKANHHAFFVKFSRNLIGLSILICLGMLIFYKFIFSHVFSEVWKPAMSIGLITAPWFGFQIAVGTLSRALFIFKKQNLKFIYDVSLIVFTMIVFLITKLYHLDIYWFFALQTISKSLLYVVYYFVIAKAVPR